MAEKYPPLIVEYIKNFGIKDKNKLFQIALKSVENGNFDIKTFEIEDKEKLFQLKDAIYAQVLKQAKRYGLNVLEECKNLDMTDKQLFRIAFNAIIHKPTVGLDKLNNYGLSSECVDNLKLFAQVQADHSKATDEYRKAFSFLIHQLRKDLPPFLITEAEHPDPFVQQKLFNWVLEILIDHDEITNEQIGREQPFFTQLMRLRNPTVRSQFTKYLSKLDSFEHLKEISAAEPIKRFVYVGPFSSCRA